VKIHPRRDVLEGLRSLGQTDRRMLQHLAGCASCRERLGAWPPTGDLAPVVPIRPEGAAEYDGIFDRCWGVAVEWLRTLERERSDAPALLAELMERSGEQRELVLRNRRCFRTWGLFELLIERSLKASLEDPALGEELGLLALRLSDLLAAEHYHAESLEDSRARAWAHVGNARRIRSDLQGADEAFRQAWEHFERGSEDLFERAILLDLDASLRRAQRRFDDAFRFLRKAVSLFLELGERHRAGRSLVNLSTVFQYSGEPERGIPPLHQALELIDPVQEPRLILLVRHNLVHCLALSGRFLEAQRASREARPLYQSFPDARLQNRRLWVEGKIARGLSQLGRAESLFLAARDGFLAEGIPYETALVSLELALLYAEQRRTAELKRLAAEMVPIFASRQIHREALAALAVFQQAVAAERADVEVVAGVADYLQKARHAPELRFQGETAR
jgi:tetratricopeptide (TPR) repeat protein